MKSKIALVVFSSVCVVLFLSLLIFRVFVPISYVDIIKENCRKHKIDPALVASLIYAESKFDKNALSKKGAVGLMQIMPKTAEMFTNDEKFDVKMLYIPEKNIEIGVSFLSYLLEKYDDEVTALACYNAGEGVVLSWMGEEKTLDISKIKYGATREYIKKIEKMKKFYHLYF